MKDFASEVLRLKVPSDGIYEFGSVYFKAIEEVSSEGEMCHEAWRAVCGVIKCNGIMSK